MDEGTNKIEQHLETEREELGRNLDEMEARVKDMTDPQVYFDKHTSGYSARRPQQASPVAKTNEG